ncbi:MAG: hypothetical protein RLZZ512_1111, partial [Bacteroidota bacterium]
MDLFSKMVDAFNNFNHSATFLGCCDWCDIVYEVVDHILNHEMVIGGTAFVISVIIRGL